MSGRYLLDTTVVIKIFANDKNILKQVEHCDDIFIASIVIGELYYGAYNSVNVNSNIE